MRVRPPGAGARSPVRLPTGQRGLGRPHCPGRLANWSRRSAHSAWAGRAEALRRLARIACWPPSTSPPSWTLRSTAMIAPNWFRLRNSTASVMASTTFDLLKFVQCLLGCEGAHASHRDLRAQANFEIVYELSQGFLEWEHGNGWEQRRQTP